MYVKWLFNFRKAHNIHVDLLFTWASNKSFQIIEKIEPFLIRHSRKCIIWVNTIQIWAQCSQFEHVAAKMFDLK